jgi:hypothetical protein
LRRHRQWFKRHIQEAWQKQNPHLDFPEDNLTLEQIVEINGQIVSDKEFKVDDVCLE